MSDETIRSVSRDVENESEEVLKDSDLEEFVGLAKFIDKAELDPKEDFELINHYKKLSDAEENKDFSSIGEIREDIASIVEEKERRFVELERKAIIGKGASVNSTYAYLIEGKSDDEIENNLKIFAHVALLGADTDCSETIGKVLDFAVSKEVAKRKTTPQSMVYDPDKYHIIALSRALMVSGLGFYNSQFPEGKRRLLEISVQNMQRINSLIEASNKEVRSEDNRVNLTFPVNVENLPYLFLMINMSIDNKDSGDPVSGYMEKMLPDLDFVYSYHPGLEDILKVTRGNPYELPERLMVPKRLISTHYYKPEDGIGRFEKVLKKEIECLIFLPK